jgi:hypothetical protein
MAQNVKDTVMETGENIIDRVKQTGENLMGHGPSLTEEAKQMACYRAQQAEDLACNGVNMRHYRPGPSMMQQARDTANDAQYRASGVFESAKQRGRSCSKQIQNSNPKLTGSAHSERHSRAR